MSFKVTLLNCGQWYGPQLPVVGLLTPIEQDADCHIFTAHFQLLTPNGYQPAVIVRNPHYRLEPSNGNQPVPAAAIIETLRAILGEIGPEMMSRPSILHAYDLMQQIEERGHE